MRGAYIHEQKDNLKIIYNAFLTFWNFLKHFLAFYIACLIIILKNYYFIPRKKECR